MIKKILIYYSFIVVTTMVLMGYLSADSVGTLISAILFFPMAVYFWFLVVPKRNNALVIPAVKSAKKTLKKKKAEKPVTLKKVEKGKLDMDRRAFIKLIGGAGMSVFLFSIFTNKAHAAFFGSNPGPGIVGLKDSSGTTIDPAEKHPTDGYKVNQLDDSVPAFYGFTNKSGAWFIMRESASGDYRYASGTSDFPTNWTGRAGLSYDYFDVVF